MKRVVGLVSVWLAACGNGGLTRESAGLTGGDSTAADDSKPPVATPRFQRAAVHGGRLGPAIHQRVGATPTTVVVTLSGQSAAELQATKGRKLTDAEKRDVRAARAAEQVAPRAAVEAAGGAVIGTF